MVELTKAEEQMMQYLWKLGEGTVQEVMASMEEKKRPSRTTVSTVIRLLEEKGLVGHKPTNGRGYIYYPLLKKVSRGLSRVEGKPWLPSTCAGDFRGLLMVALRSQGNWRWGGASRDSTGFGALEEGLISS